MAKYSGLLWLAATSLPVLILLAYQTGYRFNQHDVPDVDRSKIAVVFAGISHFSHLEKAEPLASGLVKAGYPVTFVTGEDFRNWSLSTGAHFEPLDGPAGVATAEDMARMSFDLIDEEFEPGNIFFMRYLRPHFNTIQRVLKNMLSRYESVVYIHDISFLALAPVQLGAPGILPTVSMGLGLANIAVDSRDTFPFQEARAPDNTSEARRLHLQSYQNLKNPVTLASNRVWLKKLKEFDAIEPYPSFWHSFGGLDDYLIQLGVPEFEYKRTDMVPKLRFLGIPKQPGGSRELPSWWQDVLDAEAAGKKIVVVTQGSASFDLRQLLIPTIELMADREDVFVVATTVTQEPEIEGLIVPANARLTRFIPYDKLFPLASLVVSTGGYGTVLQSIAAGVPMVLAGLHQDKAHVATLAEYVGVAVNLRTDQPSMEALKIGIDTVLGNSSYPGDGTYRANCVRIQKANAQYDTLRILDSTILEAVTAQKS